MASEKREAVLKAIEDFINATQATDEAWAEQKKAGVSNLDFMLENQMYNKENEAYSEMLEKWEEYSTSVGESSEKTHIKGVRDQATRLSLESFEKAQKRTEVRNSAQEMLGAAKQFVAITTAEKDEKDVEKLNGLITQAEEQRDIVGKQAGVRVPVTQQWQVNAAVANLILANTGLVNAYRDGVGIKAAEDAANSARDEYVEVKKNADAAIGAKKESNQKQDDAIDKIGQLATEAKAIQNPGKEAQALIAKLEQIQNNAKNKMPKDAERNSLERLESSVISADQSANKEIKKANDLKSGYSRSPLKAERDNEAIQKLTAFVDAANDVRIDVVNKVTSLENDLTNKVNVGLQKLESAGAILDSAIVNLRSAHKSGEKIDEARAGVEQALRGVDEAKVSVKTEIENEKNDISETGNWSRWIKSALVEAKKIEGEGDKAQELISELENVAGAVERNQKKISEVGGGVLGGYEQKVSEFESKVNRLEETSENLIMEYGSSPLKIAHEAIANLNMAREELTKLGKNADPAILAAAKNRHAEALDLVKNQYDMFSESDDVDTSKLLFSASEKDTAEMEKYNKPALTVSGKPSANISGSGSSEKTADLEARVKEAFGVEGNKKYEIKGDQNSVLISSKDGRPVMNVTSENIKPFVNLTGNEELTKHTLNTARELYGEPLTALSADPKEKAYIEKIAGKMGINITVAATPEAYKELQAKTQEPKSVASAGQINPDIKFSDPDKLTVSSQQMQAQKPRPEQKNVQIQEPNQKLNSKQQPNQGTHSHGL